MDVELKPMTEEEMAAGKEKYAQHIVDGHNPTVQHVDGGGYLYFVANCTCGDKWLANQMEQ